VRPERPPRRLGEVERVGGDLANGGPARGRRHARGAQDFEHAIRLPLQVFRRRARPRGAGQCRGNQHDDEGGARHGGPQPGHPGASSYGVGM
jgi:hypothetical protein